MKQSKGGRRVVAGALPDMGVTPAAEGSASDLQGALTRVAAVPAQTQHLHEILGGFCHQARNLLNCLKMSLYLARRTAGTDDQERWDDLENRYQHVERFLDRIQGLWRPLSLNLTRLPIALLFDDRAASWSSLLASRDRLLIVETPNAPAVVAFDPIRLGQAFDDLVAWRVRIGQADADLRIRWRIEGDHVQVSWDEPPHNRSRDRRPVATDAEPGPYGRLALPLLARVVALHGGSLEIGDSGPWRLHLRWPIAPRTQQGDSP